MPGVPGLPEHPGEDIARMLDAANRSKAQESAPGFQAPSLSDMPEPFPKRAEAATVSLEEFNEMMNSVGDLPLKQLPVANGPVLLADGRVLGTASAVEPGHVPEQVRFEINGRRKYGIVRNEQAEGSR